MVEVIIVIGSRRLGRSCSPALLPILAAVLGRGLPGLLNSIPALVMLAPARLVVIGRAIIIILVDAIVVRGLLLPRPLSMVPVVITTGPARI